MVGVNAEFNQLKAGRPMTQQEKERWMRRNTKEYKHFLKHGGKRPEFGKYSNQNKSEEKVVSSDEEENESSPKPSGSKPEAPSTFNGSMKSKHSGPIDITMKPSSSAVSKSEKVTKSEKEVKSEKLTKAEASSTGKHKQKAAKSDSRPSARPSARDSRHSVSESERDSSPEPTVVVGGGNTVIQCSSKSKAKSKSTQDRRGPPNPHMDSMNPFDRIISQYEKARPKQGQHNVIKLMHL